MFKNLLLFIIASVLINTTNAQQITVASFNLRYDNPGDVGNLWKDRAGPVCSLIRFHDFDILGTQEALKNQLDDISNSLPQYARYGKGRDDGKDGGEHSAIYYKKDNFKLLQSGDFWLSETPVKPGLGWDATCCNRICSWVYLQDNKTKKKFYVFNVHFDHQGVVARRESAKLMIEKIKTIAKNEGVILTGDFNADREAEPYKILNSSKILRDSYADVKYPYENNSSFNAFGKDLNRNAVIDHIFISKNLKATKWGILTDTYHGKFPSDHFPVVAQIHF